MCWGVEEHDARPEMAGDLAAGPSVHHYLRLQQLLVDDEEGTVVLFPSHSAKMHRAAEIGPKMGAACSVCPKTAPCFQ